MAAPALHPIRLVVTDDLERSRLTVFFRLLLAIPHFIWAALFGVAATFVAFLSWWAALFSGRTPRGMHGFMAGFVRYLVQVEGYVFLAANPYPPFYVGDESKQYAVDVEIDPPAPQRRGTVFFRLFLALPAFMISSALGASGGAGGGNSYYRIGASFAGVAAIAAFLIWFAALVRGRAPRGLRDLAVWGIGYGAHLGGYFFLLTDRYPNSDPRLHLTSVGELEPPPMPAAGIVTDDLRRSRLTVFFRLLLWAPHLVWWLLWTALASLVGILNWFSVLFAGRPPQPFARFLSAYVRYSVHQNAFVFLVGNPFPGFVGKPGSYPIDLELDPPQRQRRVTVFFRLFLWIPAMLVSSAAGGVLFVGALLGWFYALVRGRMPEGLRNAGAWAVTYSGQANAYLFLLSDRYPFSSPLALRWAP